MAIAQAQYWKPWFTPRYIFVTKGTQVFKVSGNPFRVTLFATLSSCGDDHTGITFDHGGTFGYNMIVTCENGVVWQVSVDPNPPHLGVPTLITHTGTELEGPAVVP